MPAARLSFFKAALFISDFIIIIIIIVVLHCALVKLQRSVL